METMVRELLIGIAANGLSDLMSRTDLRRRPSKYADAAEKAVAAAVAELTAVEEIRPSLGGERLREFLLSPEAQNVVRQIYASDPLPSSKEQIAEEFFELWRVRTGVNEPESRREIDRLFDSLITLCERSLEQAVDLGSLSALDAKEARRHGELRGAVGSVVRTLELLKAKPGLDLASVEDFALKYRRQVANREGIITPPALDASRQFPIDDLYVPARLDTVPDQSNSTLSYEAFTGDLFRSVVLGNPGSGKSTLAKKLATDLATGQIDLQRQPKGLVPMLVILRDFGAHKKEHPCSIVDFIALSSNSRYQVRTSPEIIEYLLLTSRALVIFDGLDELVDTGYRTEISGDVDSFASLYPATPMLVTSREVGYLQAPLPEARFPTFRLAEFGDSEVREYAGKWFRISDESQLGSPEEQTAAFMKDSATVSDLRSNALLLGLMCNLYKGAGYIPRNRPDVYEACAEMLFDRWDRLRQIGEPLDIESLLRPAMQHLASWIYADPELQSGVTEKDLVAEATSYLLDRRFDDEDDARLAASRFIERCRGRAWVFTDTGTTPTGEGLYQFTHRTFLEFFTAGHLVRTNASPELLLDTLTPHISVREWDVVAQLAFQLLEHNVDGASNEMLGEIVSEAANLSDRERVNRLDFAVRSLEFLVPSPKVTKALVRRSSELFAEWARRRGASRDSERCIETLVSLLCANPENVVPIQEALADAIGEQLRDREQALYAAELVLNLAHDAPPESYEREAAVAIASRVAESDGERLLALGCSDVELGADLVLVGLMPPDELVSRHGCEAFFRSRSYRVFPGAGRPSLGELVISSLLWEHDSYFDLEAGRAVLAALAGPLASTSPPWQTHAHSTPGRLFTRPAALGNPTKIKFEDLSVDERFALVAMSAIYLHVALAGADRGADRELHDLALTEDIAPVWATVLPVLRAKAEGAPEIGLSALMSLGLKERQENVLQGWLEGNHSLVFRNSATGARSQS
jgi:hypothetical protein